MITAGQEVKIKPEWRDPGDESIRWVAVDNEEKGRVTIMAELGLPINPTYVMQVEWLEVA